MFAKRLSIYLGLSVMLLHAARCQESTPGLIVPPLVNPCNDSDSDIIFVLDTSGSIGQQGFDIMMSFVKTFIDQLNIGPDGNGVGIITFSRYPTIRVPLTKFSDAQAIKDAVDQVPYVQGVTGTDSALVLLDREGFLKSDPNVSRVAIVVTDGRSASQFDTMNAAKTAKNDGIVMFSVGIGADYEPTELNSIASEPTSTHVFTVSDFTSLNQIVMQLSGQVCQSKSVGSMGPVLPTPAPTVYTQTSSPLDVCNGTQVDIFFLIDTSVSLQNGGFAAMKQFVIDVVNQFEIGMDSAEVGIITYSDYPVLRIGLGKQTNKLDLINAITKIPFVAGDGTKLDQGLEFLKNEGFNGDRPDAPNFVVVLTDGQIQDSGITQNAVNDMKLNGVVFYTIGVGQQVSQSQLYQLSSQPDSTHTFFTNNFQELSKYISLVATAVCTGAEEYNFTLPTPAPATTTVEVTYPGPPTVSTTPKPTGKEACRNQAVDMYFLVDSSGSINENEYNVTKAFLNKLIGKFDIDATNTMTQVGLITYSNKAHLEFGLNAYDTTAEIQAAIQALTHYSMGTNTAEALELLRTTVDANDRPDVQNIAVVLTDGVSQDKFSTELQAQLLHDNNVTVISVGIGNSVDIDELSHIASPDLSGNGSYSFQVKDFNALNSVSEIIAYIACGYPVIIANFPSTPGPSVATTPGSCVDSITNCDQYGMDICFDYEPWARAHCSAHCGFCGGPVTTTIDCVDIKHNCDEYGPDVCTQTIFSFWSRTNCPKFCGFCGNGTKPTKGPTTSPPGSTATPECKNRRANCNEYGEDLCHNGAYDSFARYNCAEYCNFCSNYVDYAPPAGTNCPAWHLPKECTLQYTDPNSCCPFPSCPNGFVLSALSPNQQ